MIAFAALLNAVSLPSDISPGDVAVVIVQELSGKWGDTPPCPETAICLDGIYTAKMKLLRTLAGVKVPKRFEANLWLHTTPRKQPVRAMLVQRQASGQWFTFARADPANPCFNAELIVKAGLATAPNARRIDDKICFGASNVN